MINPGQTFLTSHFDIVENAGKALLKSNILLYNTDTQSLPFIIYLHKDLWSRLGRWM